LPLKHIPINTNPIGLAFVPPLGPAIPVVDIHILVLFFYKVL